MALIAQPRLGSYSAYEDPRPGGVAFLQPETITGRSGGSPASEPGGAGASGAGDGDVGPGGGPGGSGTPPDPGAGAKPGAVAGGSDVAGAQDPGEGGPIWYVVRSGDTLSSISELYAVTVSDLWIANRLLNPNSLRPGQTLLIPSDPGEVYGRLDLAGEEGGPGGAEADEPVFHTVRKGENLWAIASRYGVTVASITRANNLPSSGVIKPGEELEIPGASGASGGRAVVLEWPVYGMITSPFGMRSDGMHEGLDLAAPRGSEIRAAASGTVTRAGRMGNYGLAIMVDHGNGLATLYAHCDQLLVARGQKVAVGQQIATVGTTGRSTGPHLHFEVILNGVRRDPLRYLLAG